ncbi:serine/threonine-protein kinase [Roseibacillus persicicus]|nr:serine/threonine-protein kinase [Roseibacillus persicicus]
MSDPLIDLGPFLEQARKNSREFLPPDYLTVRLISARGGALEPAVSPLPEAEELPRHFGPYILEAILGRGGAGTVYRGYDPELERLVAIKILDTRLAMERDAGVRFLREARAMAKLADDNLMPLLAVHQDTPAPCFTMPLLAGETLQDRIERLGPLSVTETITLAMQVGQGLATAHEADLVHRDLKPSNIFLEEIEGGTRARLMDFGLVKSREDFAMTREGEFAGTPAFMAPEQIDGLVLDGRADLYGLGATLFMALTGKPPFEARTLTATLKRAAVEEAPALSPLVPDVPSWFAALVADLLEKDPEKRPQSAHSVLSRLRERKSKATSTGLLAQNRWLIAAGCAAVGLSVLLWWTASIFGVFEPQEEFAFDTALSSLKSGDEWQVPAGTHVVESLDLGGKDLRVVGSPEGTRLVFINLTEAAFRNAGNLELENLTIDCSRAGEGESTSLVESSGSAVTLVNCRIDQRKSSGNFPDRMTLIEVPADSQTTIKGCEIYTFQSITWQMRGGANLLVEDSLVVSPGLTFSNTELQSSGEIVIRRSTCINQIGFSHLVAVEGSPPIHLRCEDSIFESSHALIWLPLGTEETLRGGIDYEGRKLLLMLDRGIVNTGARPRIKARRLGILDSWHKSDWNDFWSDQQEDVRLVEGSLIERAKASERATKEMNAFLLNVPDGSGHLGIDPKEVGPRLSASK